jgi:hypothetical protein
MSFSSLGSGLINVLAFIIHDLKSDHCGITKIDASRCAQRPIRIKGFADLGALTNDFAVTTPLQKIIQH